MKYQTLIFLLLFFTHNLVSQDNSHYKFYGTKLGLYHSETKSYLFGDLDLSQSGMVSSYLKNGSQIIDITGKNISLYLFVTELLFSGKSGDYHLLRYKTKDKNGTNAEVSFRVNSSGHLTVFIYFRDETVMALFCE
jgi:PDZ domain-containing secreted protein